MKYYIIYQTTDLKRHVFISKSKNARKHLKDLDAHWVSVYKYKGHIFTDLVSHAERYNQFIISGAIHK